MQIKTFRAPSMKMAIAAVKAELGPHAVVMSTKTIKSLSGILGRPQIEVTAGIDPNPGTDAGRETPRTPAVEGSLAEQVSDLASRLECIKRDGPDAGLEVRLNRMDSQLERLTQVLGMVAEVESGPLADVKASSPMDECMRGLVRAGVEESCARGIIRTAREAMNRDGSQSGFSALDFVAPAVMERVRIKDPFLQIGKKQLLFALVGPTGVGKTTTIAKLAAGQVFDREKKAAIVTIDTFRVGAVEQLRTYARIMDAPLEVAVDEKDLSEKIALHSDKDAIFIDTTGSSQKDAQMMRRLAGYFDGVDDIDIHLIVSATTQPADLADIEKNYRHFPIATLIASKLDESNAMGGVFNLMAVQKLPVSFFTIGQNVPDDIEVATKERVVDQLLGITAH